MRVVLIGDEIGLKLLSSTIKGRKIEAAALVCHQGRVQAESAAKTVSKELGCPVITQPPRSNIQEYNRFVSQMRDTHAEAGVCCSYDMILRSEILSLFKDGIFNLHGALLPKYRGANVLNWVLINGEKKTGVTIHLMEETVDTGPIAMQAEVPIEFDDTVLTLREKLTDAFVSLLDKFWVELLLHKIILRPQKEEEAVYVPKRHPEDGYFEWEQPAECIYNKIRALVKPWPGAWYIHDGRHYVINEFMSIEKVKEMRRVMLSANKGDRQ